MLFKTGCISELFVVTVDHHTWARRGGESATGEDLGQNRVRHLRYIYSVRCQTTGPSLQIGHNLARTFINNLACLLTAGPAHALALYAGHPHSSLIIRSPCRRAGKNSTSIILKLDSEPKPGVDGAQAYRSTFPTSAIYKRMIISYIYSIFINPGFGGKTRISHINL